MSDNTIKNEFTGIPMTSLIGGPLQAVANAQLSLASTTKNFIETVSFEQVDTGANNKPMVKSQLRMNNLECQKLLKPDDINIKDNILNIKLNIPLNNESKLYSSFIDLSDVNVDIEVKSSDEKTAEEKVESIYSLGSFSIKTEIKGCIISNAENTIKTNASAKYNIKIHDTDKFTHEELAKVLDIINANIDSVDTSNN